MIDGEGSEGNGALGLKAGQWSLVLKSRAAAAAVLCAEETHHKGRGGWAERGRRSEHDWQRKGETKSCCCMEVLWIAYEHVWLVFSCSITDKREFRKTGSPSSLRSLLLQPSPVFLAPCLSPPLLSYGCGIKTAASGAKNC